MISDEYIDGITRIRSSERYIMIEKRFSISSTALRIRDFNNILLVAASSIIGIYPVIVKYYLYIYTYNNIIRIVGLGWRHRLRRQSQRCTYIDLWRSVATRFGDCWSRMRKFRKFRLFVFFFFLRVGICYDYIIYRLVILLYVTSFERRYITAIVSKYAFYVCSSETRSSCVLLYA